MSGIWNQDRRNHGSFRKWANHFSIHKPIILRHPFGFGFAFVDPRHSWRAGAVFGLVAGWHIVAARQVVIGQVGEVEDVVSPIGVA